jgi:branched-chain amino acid transport system substrate-binding protein
LKKFLFLMMAGLLVLGLVLAGCGGTGQQEEEEEEEEEENFITIAVCGSMTDTTGLNAWDGASMAAEELNAAGGVTVGGTTYMVQLVQVETREAIEGEDGSTGTANLQAVIDDVDFCVGGFRTEIHSVYREVAMDAQKIFMNCGAGTDFLEYAVVEDYDRYKYWFRVSPYASTFLLKSCLKMTATFGSVLKATLEGTEAANAAYVKDEFKISNAVDGKLRVHIMMEDAAWCAAIVAAANVYLPQLGYTVTGTTLPSPTAADITTEMNAIKDLNPHMIFTSFSGPVGAVYSTTKADLGIPAVTIGINVPGQELDHWSNTDGTCEGEILLDTWPVGMNVAPGTTAWFDDFMARTGRYPLYTAATYDGIFAVIAAIEATDSLDADDLISYLEANEFQGVGANSRYFPMPEITITEGTAYALSEAQVRELYDIDSYGYTYNQEDWLCMESGAPHIAHGSAYGPGYQTGAGSQWQLVDGEGVKVGIWPVYLGPAFDAALTDQYGNWNFQYDGTTPYILTIGEMLNIPWDPYA